MKADLVIYGGKIVTMDPMLPVADSVAVKNGRILSVGSKKLVSGLVGPQTEVIEAGGNSVLPGFIDCHVHLTATGLNMMLNVDLSSCRCMDELLSLIKKKAETVLPGRWILCSGYNEFDLVEKRPPTLQELDAIAPRNPVWISRVCSHSGVVNTEAFNVLEIPNNIVGVEICTSGKPTGVIRAEANSYVRQKINTIIDDQTRREALLRACQKLLSVGITSVHALEGGSLFADEDVEVLSTEAAHLPVRVKLFHQTTDVESVLKKGMKQIGGCLLIDGSLGSRTAALQEPYADKPDTSGNLYFDEKELQDFVAIAHDRGLQVTVHAIGDAAIEQILTAYEKALRAKPRPDHRHRIEHVSMPTKKQIERCKKAGIIFSVQPAWAIPSPLVREMAFSRLGPERIKRLYPFASLTKGGGRVCGGSDSPISVPGPLRGIQGAVAHFNESERISRMQALSLFTTEAAWAGFEEKEKGRISSGYLADMVILDKDLFELEEQKIGSISVEMTIVGGKVLYSRQGRET